MLSLVISVTVLLFLVLGVAGPASAITVTLGSGTATLSSAGATPGITCTRVGPTADATRKATLACATANLNNVRVEGLVAETASAACPSGRCWKITTEKSGSILLLKLINTKITNRNTAGAVRSIVITAVSDTTNGAQDFVKIGPSLTNAGGKLNANFFMPSTLTTVPTGNRIELTSSLTTETENIINMTSQGPTGITLPINFTGNPDGFFEAQPGKLSTSSTGSVSITDSISVTCASANPPGCTPRLALEIVARVTCSLCGWNLPNGGGTGVDVTPGGGNSQEFTETFAPSFSKFGAWLQVREPSQFAFESVLTLGGVAPLDPANKVLHLNWSPSSSEASPFEATIEPGSFKRVSSRLWKASVRDGAMRLVAWITQFDSAGKKFGVLLTGSGADVANIGEQGTAQLTIGDQMGKELIKPYFFGHD